MLAFGVLGFLMEENGFPVAPVILGIVLGPMLEHTSSQSPTTEKLSVAISASRFFFELHRLPLSPPRATIAAVWARNAI